jgi:hypothetical protein
MKSKISTMFSRAMRITKPMVPETFNAMYSPILFRSEASERFWLPYPCDQFRGQSLYRECISLECQLAVLVQEASKFFTPTEARIPALYRNEKRAIDGKLRRWATNVLQSFLGRTTVVPSILFLE